MLELFHENYKQDEELLKGFKAPLLPPKLTYRSYNKMQIDLWDKLEYKVVEKVIDSRLDTVSDLELIQGRNRQFYRIQLDVLKLDKF